MVTINDIAKKAKVSKSTVSKVINNYSGVGDDTKEKVLKIMKENNYWPNSVARSLSTKKSYTIGIFGPQILNNFFFREVFEGIENIMGKMGYDLLYFTNKQWDESWVDYSYKEKCENRNVDGVIMMGYGKVNIAQFDRLLNSKIPSVFIDLDLVGSNTSYVTSDNVGGAKIAVEHLHNLGHQKIAMIRGLNGFKVATDRFVGFQQAIKAFNLPYNSKWMFDGDYSIETGYHSMKKILKLSDQPTAIFAEDLIAVGAIKAIREAGLNVPENYSVIGFDSIEIGRHYNLTTIAQDQIGLGEAASKLLLKIIDQKSFSPIILPTRLIVGETCKRV
jgi:LacI family transcriptional regulator/LacI family purine nucleotide synthesis repressor